MQYRSEIDGLRALAVLPVMLFHAGVPGFRGGFVGVDVFFVISGYLITSILIHDIEAGGYSLLGFYERRVRRILPALFFVMLMCLPFAWFWMTPQDLRDFAISVAAVPVFLSNVLFWRQSDYFDTASEFKPLLHTWSLAVEEQFYLVYPLVLVYVVRHRRDWLLALIVIAALADLAIAEWAARAKPAPAFFLAPFRGWELLLGAGLAITGQPFKPDHGIGAGLRALTAWGGIALIAWSVVAFRDSMVFPGLNALAPAVGTALIIRSAHPDNAAGRLLGSRVMVGVGLISYSAYLWHQPLLAFLRLRAFDHPGTDASLLTVAIALMLAYLTWRYVEAPFRDRRRSSRGQVFTFALAASAAFVALGLIGYLAKGFPSRVSAEVARATAVVTGRDERFSLCSGGEAHRFIDPAAACVIGERVPPSGAILGDSHGEALAEGIDAVLARNDLSMLLMTHGACPPALGLHWVGADAIHRCAEHRQRALEVLAASPAIEHVVVIARWTLYLNRENNRFDNGEGGVELGTPIFVDLVEDGHAVRTPDDQRRAAIKARYQQVVRLLLEMGKTVYLVYPIPEAGWNVPRQLAKRVMFEHDAHARPLSTGHDVYLRRQAEAIATLDGIGGHPKLVRIRPDRLFCDLEPGGRCVVERDGTPLYFDDDHLSTPGARLLGEEIVGRIRGRRDANAARAEGDAGRD